MKSKMRPQLPIGHAEAMFQSTVWKFMGITMALSYHEEV